MKTLIMSSTLSVYDIDENGEPIVDPNSPNIVE